MFKESCKQFSISKKLFLKLFGSVTNVSIFVSHSTNHFSTKRKRYEQS